MSDTDTDVDPGATEEPSNKANQKSAAGAPAEPRAAAKLAESGKPQASAEPDGSAEPEVSVKPDGTAKPEVSVKPDRAAKTDEPARPGLSSHAESASTAELSAVAPLSTDTAPASRSDSAETIEIPDNADLPGALAAAAPWRWWNRATPALLGVVLLAGGFLGGILVQQHWGKPTGSGSATTTGTDAARTGGERGAFPSGAPSGAAGFPGGPGAATESTVGTVKSITNGVFTLQTTAGTTVTVKIAESTRIQRSTTVAELTAGKSVTVQGGTATDGSITATSVTVS
jgi:hypothetical protein